jgi:vancomycin permeability regulator SanA
MTNWSVLAANRSLSAAGGTYEVAIVPGCHTDGLHPAPMLAARLMAALELYRAGRVKRVLVTGNERANEASSMSHWLEARGVPSADILVDGQGTRTLDSMRNAADKFGVENAVICTQRLHMARSIFLAQQAGISAVGAEAKVDWSGSLRWQAVEAAKRTLAFAESRILGRLDHGATVVAAN